MKLWASIFRLRHNSFINNMIKGFPGRFKQGEAYPRVLKVFKKVFFSPRKELREGPVLSAGPLGRPFAGCEAIVRPRDSRNRDRDDRQGLW